MANTWGSLSWSIGNFGAQEDATVEVTGASLTSTLSSPTVTATVDFGWSNNTWGETSWDTNQVDANAFPTGFPLSAVLSEEVATGEVNVGWGRNDGWNTFAWGIGGTVLLTGEQATATLDSVTTQANANVDVTGQPLTITQGEESVEISFEIDLTGQPLTANLGNVDPGPDANVTGQAMTMAQGDTLAYNLEGWGRYLYGEFVWGATGIWANVDITGISLSSNLGTLTMTGDANVDVTGQEITAAEGNADADPDANIIGIQMTMALGEETITGTATVDLTGIALSADLGTAQLDALTPGNLTGIGLTAALNSVEQIKADANVIPTGIGLSANEGSIFTLIWNEVQTDSSATWTEIDTAA